ncbi:ubiquitin-conjugating enzyme E2 G1 [Perkinsus olseni]|uniref:Ubiquitin-conjugating enzyme E2 G1 n=1 Tax=Perkinsus olseni TaxID=32597 RepID=A0A7J6UHY4_PEROL|nr:ubiquitin-conjugating enzyme E2 G1 [Perkinsus olseni]
MSVARELLKKQLIGTAYLEVKLGVSLSNLRVNKGRFVWIFGNNINNNDLSPTVHRTGPPDSLYEGGLFSAILQFPEDFPNNPPAMRFETSMWHPNVYPGRRG